MKRKRMSVFVAVCFFVCIGIIDYPFLARLYNEQVQGQVASSYEEVSEAMNEDDRMQMYQKAVEYNEWLFSISTKMTLSFYAQGRFSFNYSRKSSSVSDALSSFVASKSAIAKVEITAKNTVWKVRRFKPFATCPR